MENEKEGKGHGVWFSSLQSTYNGWQLKGLNPDCLVYWEEYKSSRINKNFPFYWEVVNSEQ